MSVPVIRVQGLGKRYTIGTATAPAYGTLRDTLTQAAGAPARLARRMAGRVPAGAAAEEETSVWALRNVSFDVNQGEALGIIGRNGAGKSTLLRMLSRITEPSEGRAEVHGRVGSLLEVRTGFHPELTGRENIFLNGSILGMSRAYIERHLDAIVEFSGVSRYIDTPVKRYSSGMYLRLAFAVAAHLEPEILIVDEVLAVGDMEFQKRCLGKMEEITGAGRTVLFVSHSMQAISQLTSRCVVLTRGGCSFDGPTSEAVQRYLSTAGEQGGGRGRYDAPEGAGGNRLSSVRVVSSNEGGVHRWGEPITFEFDLDVPAPENTLCFSFQVVNQFQQPVCHMWLFDPDVPYRTRPGRYRLRCVVPRFRLYMGSYTLTTWFSDRRSNTMIENLESICPFEVTMDGTERPEYGWEANACVYLEDQQWSPVERLAGA